MTIETTETAETTANTENHATPRFSARLCIKWGMERVFRVFAREDAVYFIRMEGQDDHDLKMVGAVSSGIVGWIVGLIAERLLGDRIAKAKREHSTKVDALSDLDSALVAHKHNFKLSLEEIVSVSLERTGGDLSSHSLHVARAQFVLRDKRKLLFELETPQDVAVFAERFSRLAPEKFAMNAAWNEKKKKFVALNK